jgi:signal peptidase II
MIVGGALGNLIDRIAYGWVIDFIDWHWYEHTWPTFNIADAAISVGVALMALEILLGMRHPAEEQVDKASKPAPKEKSA